MLKINTLKVKLTEIPDFILIILTCVIPVVTHQSLFLSNKTKQKIIIICEIKVNFFALKVELMTKEKTSL